jgi:hypothetical protein
MLLEDDEVYKAFGCKHPSAKVFKSLVLRYTRACVLWILRLLQQDQPANLGLRAQIYSSGAVQIDQPQADLQVDLSMLSSTIKDAAVTRLSILESVLLPLSLASGILSMQTGLKDLHFLLCDFFGIALLFATLVLLVYFTLKTLLKLFGCRCLTSPPPTTLGGDGQRRRFSSVYGAYGQAHPSSVWWETRRLD